MLDVGLIMESFNDIILSLARYNASIKNGKWSREYLSRSNIFFGVPFMILAKIFIDKYKINDASYLIILSGILSMIIINKYLITTLNKNHSKAIAMQESISHYFVYIFLYWIVCTIFCLFLYLV